MKSSNRIAAGSGVYRCRCCEHNTRFTGGDGYSCGLCDLCYDLSGEENHISDNGGETYDSPENIKAMLVRLDGRNGPGTALRLFQMVCEAVGYQIISQEPLTVPQSSSLELTSSTTNQESQMINVKTSSTAELVAFFNEHSATSVKKFQDRATAERRVTAIIKLLEEGFSQKPADDELAADNANQHGASSVLSDELGSEDPTDDEIAESNQAPAADPEPVKAPNPDKIHGAALKMFSTLVEDQAAEAFRKVLNKFPELTRIQFKHTAAAAGYKPLTARNAFDRIRGVK